MTLIIDYPECDRGEHPQVPHKILLQNLKDHIYKSKERGCQLYIREVINNKIIHHLPKETSLIPDNSRAQGGAAAKSAGALRREEHKTSRARTLCRGEHRTCLTGTKARVRYWLIQRSIANGSSAAKSRAVTLFMISCPWALLVK